MRCDFMHTIQGRNGAGDTCGEIDWCTLSDHICILMTGDTCEEWENIKEEWKKEEIDG